jgi:phage shock protein E
MNWIQWIIVAAAVALFLLFRRVGQISIKQAREYLHNGALVIDVRSAAEYISGHLPNALNLPLSEIEAILPRHVKDKDRVLLLHCQSGMRSGVARTKVKAMGYPNAFNLGSYARAAQIVKGK